MKLKSMVLATALAVGFATPAFANEAPASQPVLSFSAADTQLVFEHDAQPMQVATLSQTEMKATEGAFWWYVPIAVYTYAPAATAFAFTVYNSSAYMPVYHYTTFISNTWSRW